ncbi:MAG: heat-inducible transcriptional repressor HrcA [Alphaproteobacteria bacterium]|mgnify:CR=1 FL=1|jgi:heat-inducible transcriptional repressor|nr:heat-inducible transcriptional repressor HrcA [Rhodospirillaceae bacterium]MBT7612338.1 heat-inducible transcriptional repressor HrcA [Rhodospirillaceae bacterium]MDG2482686.1 heat-inducible transcriptional repressor HrcA [Alphaproteobacteria bacterium]
MIQKLNERSREIFRILVDEYVRTGEPVGSRAITERLSDTLSSASVRSVMADLEGAGLIASPHTSAGRQPTDLGLRLFVDGLLQIGDLAADDRAAIKAACEDTGRTFDDVLQSATGLLSGLSHHAGVVVAPKQEAAFRHVEFVSLAPDRALVIVVFDNGAVENRIIELPPGVPPSALMRAGNYLSARLGGRTLVEAKDEITLELGRNEAELDAVSERVVQAGLATWSGDNSGEDRGTLIVRGQANLLDDVRAMADLERIRDLFDKLDEAHHMMRLLNLAQDADGVSIFIGADNELFQLSGCSTIVAPVSDQGGKFIGALGVIGPTRMNYARIIPMVDYTAKIVGRLLS